MNLFRIMGTIMVTLAGASQADVLDEVKAKVDGEMTYRHSVTRLEDWQAEWKRNASVKPSEGNCLAFAQAYQREAAYRGFGGVVRTCELKNGEGHAFFVSKGKVLDVRQYSVVVYDEVGCR